jgi:trimethylamine:corrinoid methyltransferase-like protein
MIEKGPGNDYLAEEHTVRHMRDEFFMPQLANRQKREDLNGENDAFARARAFVSSIRESQGASYLKPGVRREILERFPEIVRFRSPANQTQERILETNIKESNRWPRESESLQERDGQARRLRA